jgi:hypothetical protein
MTDRRIIKRARNIIVELQLRKHFAQDDLIARCLSSLMSHEPRCIVLPRDTEIQRHQNMVPKLQHARFISQQGR